MKKKRMTVTYRVIISVRKVISDNLVQVWSLNSAYATLTTDNTPGWRPSPRPRTHPRPRRLATRCGYPREAAPLFADPSHGPLTSLEGGPCDGPAALTPRVCWGWLGTEWSGWVTAAVTVG